MGASRDGAPRTTAAAGVPPEFDSLRPEIAASWKRSWRSGLRPDVHVGELRVADYDSRSRLMVAAAPALDRAAQELSDTPFSLILAGRDGWIVDRRVGQHELLASLDQTGVVPGVQFIEEATGTNAIATVLETRRPIAIHGPEHYVESLKGFSCYGLPLIHPVTRRMEGIIDVTCPASMDSPLLVPFLHRAKADIEARLVEGSRLAEQRMLSLFQSAQRRTWPVLVIGEDVALANTAATNLLEPADHVLLRVLAAELPPGLERTNEAVLTGGVRVTVRFQRVAGAGVLIELQLPEKPEEKRSVIPRASGRAPGLREPWRAALVDFRARRTPVLISGEPGTGRTTAATELAGPHGVIALELAHTADAVRDLARVAESGGEQLVLIEGLELLPDPLLAAVNSAIEAGAPWLALTSRPAGGLTGAAAAVAARCVARVELPPLRLRRGELPVLLRAMLDEAGASRLRVLPQTLEMLAAHPWHGNLAELASLARHLAGAQLPGAVSPADLPDAYRHGSRGRALTPIEQIERDAIVAELRSCRGNKTHAAERLGLSRSTFYRRVRTLGIAD